MSKHADSDVLFLAFFRVLSYQIG